MNFKVRDTTWFVAVGSSVLLFMIGLFSGFFLSAIPIFFVNVLLFMVGSVTVITGAGLLLAAAEVYTKVNGFKSNSMNLAHSKLYSVAVGENMDSLKAQEVIDSLEEDAAVTGIIPIQNTNPAEVIFDIEEAPVKFIDEAINPLPLTKEELLAKIDKVQEIIHSNKDTNDYSGKNSANNTFDLTYPSHKPTIHETINHDNVESEASSPQMEDESLSLKEQSIPADLKKIILVGEKGIDPSSEKFKVLLERAYAVDDSDFTLRLKGKTFGLGARGVRVQRKNTEFTAFSKADISKMLKKF